MNRIELRGNVGQDARINRVGDNTVVRFNMATNETYKDRSGNLKEETTWHSVSAWNGKGMPDFNNIRKGVCVHVIGRLRQNRYTTAEGEERSFYEVLASRLVIEEFTSITLLRGGKRNSSLCIPEWSGCMCADRLCTVTLIWDMPDRQ